MEKYQKLFFERMKKTLSQWKLKGYVEEGNLYRFLHTVKGTAASIGLEDISNIAEQKIEQINEKGTLLIREEDWRPFLKFIFNDPRLIKFEETGEIVTRKAELTQTDSQPEKQQVKAISNEEKIHIAIIDDSLIVHELVRDQLSKQPFQSLPIDINTFRDGKTFFSSSWHSQPGKFLILLDGIMPEMDGEEVLRKLRSDYPKEKFIILMLTGRKSEEDIDRALKLGANDYLTKPFTVEDLEVRLKKYIIQMMLKKAK